MDIIDLKYDLSNSSFDLNDNIIHIYAHPEEKLHVHLKKTKYVFKKLANKKIIMDFYISFKERQFTDLECSKFLEILYSSIFCHDIGKISFDFQIKKLGISDYEEILKKYDGNDLLSDITTNHSLVSSLIFLLCLFEKADLNKNILLLTLAYSIYGHHTELKDILFERQFIYDIKVFNEYDEYMWTFLLLSKYLGYEEDINILDKLKEIQNDFSDFLEKEMKDSLISFFYSYFYSLLIKSDVIASYYFDKSLEDVKNLSSKWCSRIDSGLLDKMESSFYKEQGNFSFSEIGNKVQIQRDLDSLRQDMLNESSSSLLNSLKESPSKKVFYLNIPTGGGKTNTSMKLALDILKNTNVDRIIYAMPFINIIDQNYEVISDTYDLEDFSELRKIYSASETIFENKSDEDKSEIIMKDDFFGYPVIFTTFISLFNSILRNKKKYKYALSSLTDSIIILDEIQSLPLKNWTSLYYLINELSLNYNVYFIIMSATMPKFDNLKINNIENLNYETHDLISNPENYFNNDLFKRTKINGNIEELDMEDENIIYQFFNKIFSDNFRRNYQKGLIVFNTVKTSKFIYKNLIKIKDYGKFDFNFEIDLLNSTILPSERERIINKINSMDGIDFNYILISTQSVEAGLDVSFDFVVRDLAILDSIEQVRGRCNRSRELNKKFSNPELRGNIYLIKVKREDKYDYARIYHDEEFYIRFKETMKILGKNIDYNYLDILNYYKSVSNNINENQEQKYNDFIKNDSTNIEMWNRCKYSELQDKYNGIHLIQNKFESYSFFVPFTQDILVNDKIVLDKSFESLQSCELDNLESHIKRNLIFSINELKFLKEKENKLKLKIIKGNSIDGREILSVYYKEIIKNSKKDWNYKKIINKEFSSILYKFIFQASVFNLEEIKDSFNLKECGYFFIIPHEKIGDSLDDLYSLKTGFNFDIKVEHHDFEIL